MNYSSTIIHEILTEKNIPQLKEGTYIDLDSSVFLSCTGDMLISKGDIVFAGVDWNSSRRPREKYHLNQTIILC